MKIQLINVSIMDNLKDDLTRLAKENGSSMEFEDVLGYRNDVLINSGLAGDAFKVAKIHAEVNRLKKAYFVRDVASGIVNDDHKVIRENGMRVARDLIKYSEEDIEKVVRTGLEVSGAKHVLVIIKDNILITSRIWERIASEVAVDYGADVEAVEVENFMLGFNVYIEKYGLILADSLLGDIAKNFLYKLGEIKNTFYMGECEEFYTTDGSTNQTALAIYEMIKEQEPALAESMRDYFDTFVD